MLCRVAVSLALVVTLFCTIVSASRFLGGYFMVGPTHYGSKTEVSLGECYYYHKACRQVHQPTNKKGFVILIPKGLDRNFYTRV